MQLSFFALREIEGASDQYDNRTAKENNPNASHRISGDKITPHDEKSRSKTGGERPSPDAVTDEPKAST